MIYKVVKKLLNNSASMEYVWNAKTNTLDHDRFFNTNNSFLDVCLNRQKKLTGRILQYQAQLLIYASQYDLQKNIWDSLYDPNINTISDLISQLDAATIEKNIPDIEYYLNQIERPSISKYILINILPKCSKKTQKHIWDNQLQYNAISLHTYAEIYHHVNNPEYKTLVLQYLREMFENITPDNSSDFWVCRNLIHGLHHPITLEMPNEVVDLLNEHKQIIQRSIKAGLDLIRRHGYIDEDDDYEHVVWTQNEWNILQKNPNPNSNVHAWLENAILSVLNQFVSPKDQIPFDLWGSSESIIFYPQLVEWYVQKAKAKNREVGSNIEFAAFYHGIKIKPTKNWLETFKQYQKCEKSIPFRDYCLEHYSDQQLIDIMQAAMLYKKNKYNPDHRYSYTPGYLVHPTEWNNALKHGNANIIDLELQLCMRRWIPDATIDSVHELQEKLQLYGSMIDELQVKTWETILQTMKTSNDANESTMLHPSW